MSNICHMMALEPYDPRKPVVCWRFDYSTWCWVAVIIAGTTDEKKES